MEVSGEEITEMEFSEEITEEYLTEEEYECPMLLLQESGGSTVRRDTLVAIEEKVRQLWEDNNVHTCDAGDETGADRQKYFSTFPYPYMNGVLHLGHGFTLSKADFATRYQKLLGKNAMYPFAFHCTGMPIAACANKIKAEIKLFGNPPVFPAEEEKKEEVVKPAEKKGGKKKKKGKLAKKTSKKKYQWQIMLESGVPEDEIHLFQDASHWLNYFPPIAKGHLKQLGLFTDWRRSFITTEANPYYDAFVRWHFETLREKKKIAFGTRNSIFSPIDDQPCADHDRSAGEGVNPQDYTLIKLPLVDVPTEVQTMIDENKDVQALVKEGKTPTVFLPAATLRPETMYGQTNLFILPTGNYGVYLMRNGDIFVCSARSALNMSYQKDSAMEWLTAVRGKPTLIGNALGSLFLGKRVSPPMSTTYEHVYILPLLTIKMGKGTGVVTSVPSDAPDDYAALMDLKNKPALRAKFGLTEEMVLPFDVVPIIETPGLGSTPAKDLCIEMKVKSQNDKDKLAIIKEKCYTTSFYKGVMLVGELKGQPVSAAKLLIKEVMIKAGTALAYSEPEKYVESRTGNECVVASADQWYLNYGEQKWKDTVVGHVNNTLHTYNPVAKKKFLTTLGWLKEWACSRTFGLGTKLPWDEKWVIESLSDSTIYMAYYTISHILQGNMNGTEAGSGNISPAQMTTAVFNYILRNKEFPEPPETDIPVETLNAMKKEFEYWYPMDMRVSGKDLINNHLTMSLYNHAAVWDSQPEMWPRSFFTNGHLGLNGTKMSKSTGNWLILKQAMDAYGVDATRFTLADSGDGLDDANFEAKTANASILKLTKEDVWIKEIFAGTADNTLVDGPASTFFDAVFENTINAAVNDTKANMDEMQYHAALATGFYALIKARDVYRHAQSELNRGLVERWSEVFTILLSPFCPHFTQHIWTSLGKPGFVVNATWPTAAPEDKMITRKFEYLKDTAHHVTSFLAKAKANANRKKKKGKKGKQPEQKKAPVVFNAATIYVADAYPSWQATALRIMNETYAANDNKVPDKWVKTLVPQIKALPEIKANKRLNKAAMQFVGFIAKEVGVVGAQAMETKLPFDEQAFLTANVEFVKSASKLDVIVVQKQTADSQLTQHAVPGKPIPFFFDHTQTTE